MPWLACSEVTEIRNIRSHWWSSIIVVIMIVAQNSMWYLWIVRYLFFIKLQFIFIKYCQNTVNNVNILSYMKTDKHYPTGVSKVSTSRSAGDTCNLENKWFKHIIMPILMILIKLLLYASATLVHRKPQLCWQYCLNIILASH